MTIVVVVVVFFFGTRAHSGPGPSQSRGFQITHNDTPQSVGLLWTSDQLVAETSAWQHTTLPADRHPFPRWDSNPQSQQASGCRPRGHWGRHHHRLLSFNQHTNCDIFRWFHLEYWRRIMRAISRAAPANTLCNCNIRLSEWVLHQPVEFRNWFLNGLSQTGLTNNFCNTCISRLYKICVMNHWTWGNLKAAVTSSYMCVDLTQNEGPDCTLWTF